jgi:uncharacterized protein (DUF302 family)
MYGLYQEGTSMNNVFGFDVTLNQSYEQAIETVTAALKTQGFGVLTRIDVRATLKEKLGVDFRPYTILGACNPPLAHRALEHAPEVGLMLPCNVTVEESAPGQTLVRIANPALMVQTVNRPDDPVLQEVAETAQKKMESVVQALQQTA